MRTLVSVGIASLVALGALSLSASPVAAECSYLPPWPKATEAIQSAETVIVGDMVDDFDLAELGLTEEADGQRAVALRVTEVLRGDYRVGQLVDIQYLPANWPYAWTESGPVGSCSINPGWAGDRIVLALDAVQPSQRLEDLGHSWIQPATVYNAVGVLEAGPTGLDQRETVTMQNILRLVALPMTDAPPSLELGPAERPMGLAVAVLAGLLAGLAVWRRSPPARRS
jgi:hypothetical protein